MIQEAVFLGSFPSISTIPRFPLHSEFTPEVAVVGRSNVGKSSLLNYIFSRKNLVKTSSTPGKTQALNLFSADKKWIFTDLPGYGYAKVSQKQQQAWAKSIEEYLSQRTQLKLILFLFDIRRIPKEEDVEFKAWMDLHKIPSILILTKGDKLSKNQRERQKKLILSSFQNSFEDCILSSTLLRVGKKEILQKISAQLG